MCVYVTVCACGCVFWSVCTVTVWLHHSQQDFETQRNTQRGQTEGYKEEKEQKRHTRETTLTQLSSFLWHINGNISRYLINPSHIRKTARRQLQWRDLERLTHSNDELWTVSFIEQREAMLICDQQQPIINVSDWTADITRIRDECVHRTESQRQKAAFFSPTSDSSATYLTYVASSHPWPSQILLCFLFCGFKANLQLVVLYDRTLWEHLLLSPAVKEVFWPLTKVKYITKYNKQKNTTSWNPEFIILPK